MTSKYHTFWKRFGAGLIDGLIFLPFAFIGDLLDKNSSQNVFIIWSLLNTFCWTLYVVVGHGKYGQTIGKRLVHIKVLDLGEKTTIGYKRAFYREGIWLLADISGLIYFVYLSKNEPETSIAYLQEMFENYMSWISFAWLAIELLTMMFNSKRRALHDYIAGSVVLDVDQAKREELQETHLELIASLKSD